MRQQSPLLNSENNRYKAVCHKCQTVGFEPNVTTCQQCGFPLLLESVSSVQLSVRDILDRSTIELKGERQTAPLPGVNRTERQKREMLERAQRRLATGGVPAPASAPSGPVLIDRTARIQHPAPAMQRSVTDSPVYSERDETFIFRSQQRAETYHIQHYPQDIDMAQAAAINLHSRPRLGMVLAVVSALVFTLVTAAGI